MNLQEVYNKILQEESAHRARRNEYSNILTQITPVTLGEFVVAFNENCNLTLTKHNECKVTMSLDQTRALLAFINNALNQSLEEGGVRPEILS